MEQRQAWHQEQEPTMSNLHSLAQNALAAGVIYGWRIDAIIMGGLLWALLASYTQLRAAIA
jgi:hypothetical protein